MTDQFYYTFQGHPDRPVLLFLHGFLGSHTDFDAVISRVHDRYRCLAIDLPGHGQTKVTGKDEAYTMPKIAAAIVGLLDQLNIAQADLVGYSMGGRLALYLAIHYPKRFPKAVIESGSPGLKTEIERSTRLQRDFSLAKQIETNFEKFLSEWYEQPLFQSFKQHPQFEQIFRQRLRNDPIELAKSLRLMSIGMQPSLWDALPRHQNLILLLVGERDQKFIAINQEMVSICETARFAIVPKVGHNIHFEDPETFATHLHLFLSSVPS